MSCNHKCFWTLFSRLLLHVTTTCCYFFYVDRIIWNLAGIQSSSALISAATESCTFALKQYPALMKHIQFLEFSSGFFPRRSCVHLVYILSSFTPKPPSCRDYTSKHGSWSGGQAPVASFGQCLDLETTAVSNTCRVEHPCGCLSLGASTMNCW